MKIQKKKNGGVGGGRWGGGGAVGVGLGGQSGCERRRVFVKIQKKIFFFWGGGRGGRWGRWGGSGEGSGWM